MGLGPRAERKPQAGGQEEEGREVKGGTEGKGGKGEGERERQGEKEMAGGSCLLHLVIVNSWIFSVRLPRRCGGRGC